VPTSVLAASFLGSAHCVGMCGGLVTSACRDRMELVQYHLGRLAGYALWGAVAGAVGDVIFGSVADSATHAWLEWMSWTAALGMAGLFVMMGFRVWRGGIPHLQMVPQGVLSWLYRRAGRIPAALGALSSLLPCGWLQSFVLAAAATRSPMAGAGLMGVFWLGTLPALASAPWLANRLLRPFFARTPKVAALLLVLAGVSGLGFKMSPLLGLNIHAHPEHSQAEHMHHCH
jgi:sulfite exporter TauE/SafE